MPNIQILLITDHGPPPRGITGHLLGENSSFQVAAHCCSPDGTLDAIARYRIDLVLLDCEVSNKEKWFQLIKRVRDGQFTGRIFLITSGMANGDYVRALGLGVCGIFLKQSSPQSFTEAICRVMTGETWIDERCLWALIRAIDRQGSPTRERKLTERETHVLKGIVSGLSNKEIGFQLNISEASVKSALQQLFLKTGARRRSHLVRIAWDEYGAVSDLRPVKN